MINLRTVILGVALVTFFGFLGYQAELTLPQKPPSLNSTLTPLTQLPPRGVGSYDVLGYTLDKPEADRLLQTEAGQELLSPDHGAVAITDELIDLGREAFYTETFGNEVLFTDIIGILDGPLNLKSISKAVLGLKGQGTTNLQVPIAQDLTLGGQTFLAGTVINTGLDVPKGSLLPLGMVTRVHQGQVQVGVTCALCHGAVDRTSGKVMEGAPNPDVNLGTLLAMGSNSAALFRQTDVNPTEIAPGSHAYLKADGETAYLPDADRLEEAVDAALLSWPPGNFVSNGDLENNSAQIPSSYTHETFPYAWSGVAAIGWFHGLTTLNNAVFGVNADPTTTADVSETLLGIDKETYLGAMFQNASHRRYRLPEGVRPSEFVEEVDPTPGEPGINRTIRMPGYPKGSLFMQNGLMAATPGLPVAAQLNGMSAWQNTLAPPPQEGSSDIASITRGSTIFQQANCAQCHSGRYFTNHRIIAQPEVGSEPARAVASAGFAKIFSGSPQTYPSNVSVPLPPNPPVLNVPTAITPQEDLELAYAKSNPAGGYKVQNLIGLYATAPYLHDGGVAASREALRQKADGWFEVADPQQLGMVGTWMQGIEPDAAFSLRVLVDRTLREPTVAANQANANLQRSHVDGSGHNYWVDQQAGFSPQDQTDLIQFLLSIDDDPEVLPETSIAQTVP